MISRIIAGVLAGALVISAAAVESDTGRLSPRRTAAQVVQQYGAHGNASCREKQGYWTYVCRVREPTRTFTVDVRVDDNSIVDHDRR